MRHPVIRHPFAVFLAVLGLIGGTGVLAQENQSGPGGPGNLRAAGQSPREARQVGREARKEERFENRRLEQNGTGWESGRRRRH